MRHRSGIHRRDTRLVRLAPAHTPPPQARNTIYNIWPEKRHQCCRRRLRASPMPERRRNLPTIHHGDCIETMNAMPPESIDAIVTDPPYGLSFMQAKWDATPPGVQWAEACYRVLKPGGHIAAFGGTRTWHRLAVAIEDAGFEMRDSLAWLYGSGFPKSHDVGKAIDKLAGAEREGVGGARQHTGAGSTMRRSAQVQHGHRPEEHEYGGMASDTIPITAPATPEAAQWDGWGTALKPAFEPIVLARKPIAEKTVARNVLAHGTGAINVDACRIETDDNLNGGGASGGPGGAFLLDGAGPVDELRALAAAGEKTPNGRDAQATLVRALTSKERGRGEYVQPSGRWPANVLLDEHAAAWVDEQSGVLKSGDLKPYRNASEAEFTQVHITERN